MEATIRGCRLYYRWEPKEGASGSAVVLLHGWGCDDTIFSFIETELGARASVLTLDFPGHGKSGEPPEPWGVQDFMEQLYELMGALDVRGAYIVAHSFGARVAIYLAARHPDAVGKLILTGAAGIRKPATDSQRKRQKRFKRYRATLDALAKVKPLAPLTERWQTALRNRFGSADYAKLDENMRKTFVKVVEEDLLPLLGDIQAPALLVWGSEDTATPLWMGQEMEKRIPDAGLVVFAGRTHFAFIEEWPRFALIAKEFFWGGNRT